MFGRIPLLTAIVPKILDFFTNINGLLGVNGSPVCSAGKNLFLYLEKYWLLKEQIPLMVIATCGTTVTGGFDPLEDIANICERHGVWLHADVCAQIIHTMTTCYCSGEYVFLLCLR